MPQYLTVSMCFIPLKHFILVLPLTTFNINVTDSSYAKY